MNRPSELSHEELVELVTRIQWTMFGRESSSIAGVVDYLDRDNQFLVEMLDDIAIELHALGLTPSLGSTSAEWQSATLYICDACMVAWERAALRARGDADSGRAGPLLRGLPLEPALAAVAIAARWQPR